MPIMPIHVIQSQISHEDLVEEVAKMQKVIRYLLSGNIDFENIIARGIKAENIETNTITANEIAANTITADRMDVDELSAISANLGKVVAGILIGAYISTADGTYPRIDFSSTDNLLKAMMSETNYVSIIPNYANNPAYYFDNGAISAIIGLILNNFQIVAVQGNLSLSSSTGDVFISSGTGAGRYVRFAGWDKVFSTSDNQTLRQALNYMQNQINDLRDRVYDLERP